jgi:DNA adenine methylase
MPATFDRISPPLKWHGGKHYLAPRLVALMPRHLHYVEPFAGGLSVLLAKDPDGVSEVVNDIDGSLSNFWRVLRGEETFRRFERQLAAMPFSETEWRAAGQGTGGDAVDNAVRFFVRCRQSLAGRMDCFAPLSRTRTRRRMNEQVSAWLNAVEGLPAVHARLRRVAVLNRDARDVIRQQDGPDTLFYLDPPYLGETRASDNVYAHELTAHQHGELLDAVCDCQGKVVLSGYPSGLYDGRLRGWTRHEFTLPNQAAGGTTKRRMTEVAWCNFQGLRRLVISVRGIQGSGRAAPRPRPRRWAWAGRPGAKRCRTAASARNARHSARPNPSGAARDPDLARAVAAWAALAGPIRRAVLALIETA